MTRSQLEHIIRAAGTIADDEDIVVVGSQATLGEFPEAPEELLVSREAVVYPRTHGVGPETAVLPAGWEGRLVMVSNANTRFVRGWCLEVHDLAISKLVAGREKDLDFVGALGRHGMARGEVLRERLAVTELDGRVRELVAGRIGRCFDFVGAEEDGAFL